MDTFDPYPVPAIEAAHQRETAVDPLRSLVLNVAMMLFVLILLIAGESMVTPYVLLTLFVFRWAWASSQAYSRSAIEPQTVYWDRDQALRSLLGIFLTSLVFLIGELIGWFLNGMQAGILSVLLIWLPWAFIVHFVFLVIWVSAYKTSPKKLISARPVLWDSQVDL